ncbi:GNAT family protein [Paenibacillus sp. HB172176]|uniref:GNAT family N-acetyltransferase n=1 Tax=Paenibacillus sp. HB172176 TaxID=2493690 RepID=UPI00143ACE78|nr:GNAT family protein [Paenibacillus sp. HB172176]
MLQFPILETERLILRQIKQEDSREIYNYFSLEEVTKYYDLVSFTNINQAEELINRWNQRFERNQGIRWGITLKSENRVIGTCGFHSWMKNHHRSEIGYELTPQYWRKGIMTEAILKVVEFGFNNLELNRIEAFVEPENVNSRKVLERIEFREEGILREHFYWRNRFVDTAIYSILKKDFKEK